MSKIVESRPNTFPECTDCSPANEAVKRGRQAIGEDSEQILTATVTIKCEGGSLINNKLGVRASVEGTKRNRGVFLSFLPPKKVECPGLKAWRLQVLDQGEKT